MPALIASDHSRSWSAGLSSSSLYPCCREDCLLSSLSMAMASLKTWTSSRWTSLDPTCEVPLGCTWETNVFRVLCLLPFTTACWCDKLQCMHCHRTSRVRHESHCLHHRGLLKLLQVIIEAAKLFCSMCLPFFLTATLPTHSSGRYGDYHRPCRRCDCELADDKQQLKASLPSMPECGAMGTAGDCNA